MADRVGQQLGNYRLVRLLGQGGFAEVYLGEHIRLNTQAAIKVLHTQLAKSEMDGFLNEARTIASLKHPHIVRVLDFDVEDGIPFLVMEYAPNGSLRELHPRGSRLQPATIVPYIKQIATALQYAHEKKLIHRDIKPENMLLGEGKEILLSDFGIALMAQSSRYQNTQDAVGTLAYMAPEQLQGHPRIASDQYSLGIVVYEWLSGDRPFHGSFIEVASQHMLVAPPPLREKVPTLSPAVEEVVMVALAKDPQQRFLSVQAFATALEQSCLPASSANLAPTVVVIPPKPPINLPPTVVATPYRDTPAPQKTSEQWLQEGLAHYNRREYQEAIASFDQALRLNPNDADIYFNRGLAYYQMEEYRKAINDYNRALRINPNDADIFNNRGLAYHDLEDYRNAIASYNQALYLDPTYVLAYNNRGNTYADLEEYQKAIADYNQALRINSNDAVTYFNRGLAYADLKQYQKAIADYDQALRIDPNYTLAKENREEAYRKLRRKR